MIYRPLTIEQQAVLIEATKRAHAQIARKLNKVQREAIAALLARIGAAETIILVEPK